jgi:hypothetical protein
MMARVPERDVKSGANQAKINTSPITNVAIKNPISH